MKNLPAPLPEKCGTCPFREGSRFAFLTPELTASALFSASRICHNTGKTGLLGNTGKPERLCRGARDVQLNYYHRQGVIAAPTDAAWAAAWDEMKARR